MGYMLLEFVAFEPADLDGITTLTQRIDFVVYAFDTEKNMAKSVCLDCPELRIHQTHLSGDNVGAHLPLRYQLAAFLDHFGWDERLACDWVGR